MRAWGVVWGAVLVLTCSAYSQQAPAKSTAAGLSQAKALSDTDLKKMLESKVRAEWDAFKNKDKTAFAALLADDYAVVESDGNGSRDKLHAVDEVDQGTVRNYSLYAFRVHPLCRDAAMVTYENTLEFFPKAQVRFLRVYISEVWMRRDGKWQARYSQETRVK